MANRTFNQIKELAGLPCQKRRLSERSHEDKPIRAARRPEGYAPRYHNKQVKGPAVKKCLGYTDTGGDCKKMVPGGHPFCPRCKAHKDSGGWA